MRTSKEQKSWKEKMIHLWESLVSLSEKAKNSPTVKRIVKALLELAKFLFSILLKKVIEHFLKDF